MNIMDKLIDIYHNLLNEQKEIYERKCFARFKFNNRLIGLFGPRGVGKTTFILNFLLKNYKHSDKALYVSADNLYFIEHNLVDLVDKFHKEQGGEFICIDEINKYKNWQQELKNIHDSYPQIKVVFSGSSGINLTRGKYDLSRRVVVYQLNGFSFREYLDFFYNIKTLTLSLKEIIKDPTTVSTKLSKIPKLIGYFHEYLKMGYYPFFKEHNSKELYYEALLNIIDKIIYEDISSFYSLKTENLNVFKKILYFFATSTPGLVNTNKLANSLGKDNKTINQYLEILRETEVLKFLLNDKKGHSLVRNAEKIYLENSNLIYAVNQQIGKTVEIGTIRELFIINQLENAGYKIFYSEKDDLRCEDNIFKIGGGSKKFTQIEDLKNSFLLKDNILIGSRRTIPLYLFGFIY